MRTRTRHSQLRTNQPGARRPRNRYFWLLLLTVSFVAPVWLVSNLAHAQEGSIAYENVDDNPFYRKEFVTVDTAIGEPFGAPILVVDKDVRDDDLIHKLFPSFSMAHPPRIVSIDEASIAYEPERTRTLVSVDYASGPIFSAKYNLANQAQYVIGLGSVKLGYGGAMVQMTSTVDCQSGPCRKFVDLTPFSGWAHGTNEYAHDERELTKGFLARDVVAVDVAGGHLLCTGKDALYVYRYRYIPPSGGSGMLFFQKPKEQTILSKFNSDCSQATIGPAPTQYFAEDGSAWLDVSNECQPVIHFADGSFEEFHQAAPGTTEVNIAPWIAPFAPQSTTCDGRAPLRKVDANGNVTTFTYPNGRTRVIQDPKGRTTTLTFEQGSVIANRPIPGPSIIDTFWRLTSVAAPGVGGSTLNYTVNWTTIRVDLASAFSDVTCFDPGGNPAPCFGDYTFDVVSSIVIPDGRSYSFAYGPRGNLTRVTEPSGAVRVYEYGDATNTAYAAASLPLTTRTRTSYSTSNVAWTGQEVKMQERGIIREKVYPNGDGPSQPVNVRTINFEKVDLGGCDPDPNSGAARSGAPGCVQVWKVTTNPDGSVLKAGFCAHHTQPVSRIVTTSGPPSGHNWAIGEELYSTDGQLVSATYHGDKTTGILYDAYETQTTYRMPEGPALDRRPLKIVNIKNGVQTTTTMSYADVIDLGGGTSRNPKNITSTCVWAGAATDCNNGSGTKMVQTDTSYFHPVPYYSTGTNSRNLLHLPLSTAVTDPARGLLTLTGYTYDEYDRFPLVASGAPNLDLTIGPARGNVTTATSYRDAANGTGQVSSETHYFDTGDPQQTLDPLRRNPTTKTYTFGLCSSNPFLVSTVTNILNHQTTTVSDCFTGQILRVTDPNNQSTYSQYDNLGRLVETAVPGDTLTAIPGFVRDPDIPPDRLSGSILGNNGQGPTTWIEYLSLGVINQQRTVTHTKDGTTDGRYTKTFIDGMGRTIQVRSEVDPATANGNAENVATTEYDNMGRVSKSFVPCFSSAQNSVTPHCSSLATMNQYDALGRVVSFTLPGLPATTTTYEGSGTQFLATATDANGNLSKVFTDVLGHTVKTSRRWIEGQGQCTDADPLLGTNWCSTVMQYDAADRLLSTTDPGGNLMSFVYDGLGRKTDMTDPDMGHWHYEYDDNGNLISQTDAKGQVITMQYDALNRITLKDLPPAGPGEEDVTYFYDGNQPTTCYSCDDHCAGTTDTCDAGTGTCVHTGTPCDGGPPPPTPPVAPGNLAATAASSSQINLSWTDNSNDETGFNIERSLDGGLTFSLLTTVAANTTSYSDTGLTPGTTYYYQVKATNGAGDSAPSNVTSATTSVTVPNAPTNLAAAAISSTQINLSWTDNSNNETGFKIERSLDGGVTFSLLATVGTNITSYSNTGLTPNTTYHYRVKATNSAGDSTPSNVASATTAGTPPNAPTNLTATAISSTQINLSWTDNSNNETGFKIERSLDGGLTFSLLATVGANITSYSNTGLIPNTTYHYRVKATNGAGDSGPSNVAGATTPPQCTFAINPTGSNVPPGGVTGSTVTVTANCPWTAVSNASWIVITGGSSGNGNGAVTYNVLSNPGAARSGTMLIAGFSFTVFQDGCTYFLTPQNETFSYTSTQSSVVVSAPGGCSWTAVSNTPWLTINSGSSGSGTGTVTYTVAANTSTTWPNNRTGTMTIAGQTFTATQSGQPDCPNSAGLSCDSLGLQSCQSKCFLSNGGSATVYVWLSRTDCDWLPRTSDSWIHITSVTNNGSNPRSFTYSVDANTGAPPRVGVILVNGLRHTVTEAGSSSTVTGRVTTSSGQGLAGVTITFSALISYPGIPAPVITDVNGNWTQSGFVSCKSNFATPSKSGYTFSPSKRGFNPGVSSVDFLATQTQSSLEKPSRSDILLASASMSATQVKEGAPQSKRISHWLSNRWLVCILVVLVVTGLVRVGYKQNLASSWTRHKL